MELRHLRYFIAVAEEGSLKLAAERRLHTAQPSLSRQIRDLENEVGAELLIRSARGVELTAAGRAFFEHARLTLAQAEAAVKIARRAAHPTRPVLAVGFLVGHEVDCIPPTTRILRDELPNLEIRIFSGFSVDLANDLQRGQLDVAFLRREPVPELQYRLVMQEPLVAILPSDHPLAARNAFDPRDLANETFIGISTVPRVLRQVVNQCLERSGVHLIPQFEIDNFAMAISLVGSIRGIALLPASVDGYLPASIVSRPLDGAPASIDLMIGFHKENRSRVLDKFLSKAEELAAQVQREPVLAAAAAARGQSDPTRRAGEPYAAQSVC